MTVQYEHVNVTICEVDVFEVTLCVYCKDPINHFGFYTCASIYPYTIITSINKKGFSYFSKQFGYKYL